ncbi:MAG: hypothetical protein ACXWQO_13230 [Bdellovibrionota bacterium]
MKNLLMIAIAFGIFSVQARANEHMNLAQPLSSCANESLSSTLAAADQVLASSYQPGSAEEQRASEIMFCLFERSMSVDQVTFKKILKTLKALNHLYCQVHEANC